MVELLLQEGAHLVMTKLGDTPVDIAGYCDNEDTVLVFLNDLERRIRARIGSEKANPESNENNSGDKKFLASNKISPNLFKSVANI